MTICAVVWVTFVLGTIDFYDYLPVSPQQVNPRGRPKRPELQSDLVLEQAREVGCGAQRFAYSPLNGAPSRHHASRRRDQPLHRRLDRRLLESDSAMKQAVPWRREPRLFSKQRHDSSTVTLAPFKRRDDWRCAFGALRVYLSKKYKVRKHGQQIGKLYFARELRKPRAPTSRRRAHCGAAPAANGRGNCSGESVAFQCGHKAVASSARSSTIRSIARAVVVTPANSSRSMRGVDGVSDKISLSRT
jgi:hypothetical protein